MVTIRESMSQQYAVYAYDYFGHFNLSIFQFVWPVIELRGPLNINSNT